MRMVDLIEKKRDGGVLTDDEIRFIIRGFTDGSIPDYQMSAFAMTVFYKGMTDHETAVLTDAMMHSGDTVDLSRFGDKSVDKHSTGGVGDKTTLIVAPIVSSLGGKMAKMSGRGLGHTGGTVDKLESIPGYQTTLSADAFMRQVEQVGVAVIGQSGNLTPADKKLYALRDVTETVDCLPLVVSSGNLPALSALQIIQPQIPPVAVPFPVDLLECKGQISAVRRQLQCRRIPILGKIRQCQLLHTCIPSFSITLNVS